MVAMHTYIRLSIITFSIITFKTACANLLLKVVDAYPATGLMLLDLLMLFGLIVMIPCFFTVTSDSSPRHALYFYYYPFTTGGMPYNKFSLEC